MWFWPGSINYIPLGAQSSDITATELTVRAGGNVLKRQVLQLNALEKKKDVSIDLTQATILNGAISGKLYVPQATTAKARSEIKVAVYGLANKTIYLGNWTQRVSWEGNFSFAGLPLLSVGNTPTSYVLTITHPEFEPFTKEVVLTPANPAYTESTTLKALAPTNLVGVFTGRVVKEGTTQGLGSIPITVKGHFLNGYAKTWTTTTINDGTFNLKELPVPTSGQPNFTYSLAINHSDYYPFTTGTYLSPTQPTYAFQPIALRLLPPPPAPPKAPTYLSATRQSGTSNFRLKWADNSSNENGFELDCMATVIISGTVTPMPCFDKMGRPATPSLGYNTTSYLFDAYYPMYRSPVYKLKVRAWRLDTARNTRVYSPYSNTITLKL
mgnify:CR=1 FL=1